MATKDELINLLENSGSDFISGNEIAKQLGITRAAIWKAIKQLENEGYDIEAVTNKGYRIGPTNDCVSVASLNRYLGAQTSKFSIDVYDEIGSTNNVLKENASTLPSWHIAVANSQNAGRGRLGRSFYSPKGTGIYISIFLRHNLPLKDAEHMTTVAAIAACRAIDECTGHNSQIKWINDVYLNGKKACGILTEGSISMETGSMEWAVVGIGFNVYMPKEGFPEEIKDIATAISQTHEKDLRSKLAAAFIKNFYDIFSALPEISYLEEYKKRSFVLGNRINVIKNGTVTPALALDIDDDCHLIVKYDDGRIETLNSGEVSTKIMK